jgi:hypothetical protein
MGHPRTVSSNRFRSPQISRQTWMDRRSEGSGPGGPAENVGPHFGWDEQRHVAVWSDAPLRRRRKHRGRSKGLRLKQNASHLLQSASPFLCGARPQRRNPYRLHDRSNWACRGPSRTCCFTTSRCRSRTCAATCKCLAPHFRNWQCEGRRYHRGGASYARLRSVARGRPGDRARIPRGWDGSRSEWSV